MPFVSISSDTAVPKPTPSFTPIGSEPAAPAAPQHGIVSKIGSAIGGAYNAWSNFVTTKVFDPFVSAINATGAAAANVTEQLQKPISQVNWATVGSNELNVISNGLAMASQPAMAPYTVANNVPVIGHALDPINAIFESAGKLGATASDITHPIINLLPISDADKTQLKDAISNAGSTAAQFAIGGYIFHRLGAATEGATVKDMTPSEVTSVVDGTKAFADKMASDHPAEPAEPTQSAEEPSSEAPKPATIAPEAPEEAPTPSFKPLNAPEAAPEAPETLKPPSSQEEPVAPKQPLETTKPDEIAKPLQTAPGQSKIGKSIEVKAVDAKLTEGFKGTAGYDPITIKEQAARATKLVTDDIDQARAIVRGDAPLPDGLKGTSLIIAMEEHLKVNPDGELAHELANSPLVSATSGAAQELRLAAERIPDSITAKFREVKAAREANAEKRGGMKKQVEATKSDIKKEIKRAASKPQTWDEFIQQVQCQY